MTFSPQILALARAVMSNDYAPDWIPDRAHRKLAKAILVAAGEQTVPERNEAIAAMAVAGRITYGRGSRWE